MRVGLIAPPWVPVPPPAYGGTEVVIDQLARGLVRAGHEVRLFTIAESTCPVPSAWRYEHAMPMQDSLVEAKHALAAYDALEGVDVVHDHTVLGPLLARRRRHPAPVLATIHSPFTADVRRITRATAGTVALICISADQRRSAPEIPVAAVIHHGLDPADFPFGQGAGGYLLFLGRMSPDKGADRAIAVARAAGARLLIAAKMRDPAERAFYRERVEPLLGSGIEYLGEVDPARRLDLLRGAVALLNPIQWAEPFGLVMIEALACGTPVISRAIGSAPEIVQDGHTGYLCADQDEYVRAVGRVGALSRQDCRDAVLARFTTDRMVRDHVALYRSVLRGAAGRPATPAADPIAEHRTAS